jgi:hypothetical protein
MAKRTRKTAALPARKIEDLIDMNMEVAATAGAIDHHTQLSSWSSITPASHTDAELAALAAESSEPPAEFVELIREVMEEMVEEGTIVELNPEEIADKEGAESAEHMPEGIETAEPIPDEIDTDKLLAAIEAEESTDDVPGTEPVETDVEADVIEALEAAEEETGNSKEAPTTEEAAPQGERSEESWEKALEGVEEAQIEETVFATADAFDDRVAFESSKAPDNTSIQRTLKKARAAMVTKRAAKVMILTNVRPAVINRVLHEGNRYNVYAIGKLADIIFGVTDGQISNAINIACIKSLFRFHAAKLPFTADMAKAAASNKIRVSGPAAMHLVRHTVSASTAPTQASSTMQALETLGVVRRTGGGRNPVFEVVEGALTTKIKELLAAV